MTLFRVTQQHFMCFVCVQHWPGNVCLWTRGLRSLIHILWEVLHYLIILYIICSIRSCKYISRGMQVCVFVIKSNKVQNILQKNVMWSSDINCTWRKLLSFSRESYLFSFVSVISLLLKVYQLTEPITMKLR